MSESGNDFETSLKYAAESLEHGNDQSAIASSLVAIAHGLAEILGLAARFAPVDLPPANLGVDFGETVNVITEYAVQWTDSAGKVQTLPRQTREVAEAFARRSSAEDHVTSMTGIAVVARTINATDWRVVTRHSL